MASSPVTVPAQMAALSLQPALRSASFEKVASNREREIRMRPA
jgi:hypothetical protein